MGLAKSSINKGFLLKLNSRVNNFCNAAIANNNIQWLALKTLGLDEEANDLLQPLDQPEFLGRLIQLLSYTHFDPAPYPNLSKHLEKLGVPRHDVSSINFACKR